tara:strand:- start:6965 stop:8854 length:1890 start_codon:yes stop_codon:yes gene_type:complete
MATYNNNNGSKDIRYTGRDFSTLKQNLIEHAKNYFPSTVKDFSAASPSTMFIEMAAYVGDVLSYYTDYAMKETMLHQAQEKKNVYSLAQAFGYKPRLTTPSTVELDVYILVPSTGTGANVAPDMMYAPRIEKGMVVSSDDSVKFRTLAPVDFATSSSSDPLEITEYQTNAVSGLPEYYLFKKKVSAQSGEARQKTINVGAAQEYFTVTIDDNKVQSIESIVDSDGMNWTEVSYLAQETVFDETVNSVANDPYMSEDSSIVPYILKLKKVDRRFITRVTPADKLQIQFGSGISSADSDEEIIPNPSNVGANMTNDVSTLDKSFDPANFLYTNTYGLAPSNTQLTITYLHGYGLKANVAANSIKTINAKTITFNPLGNLISSTRQTVVDSIYIENNQAATGGATIENLESVRQNALGNNYAQNRMVTKEDYIIRAMSIPSKFGSVAKAFVASDEQMRPDEVSVNNPLAVNLYVLTYDSQGKLTTLPRAAKENLRTYLSQYRLMTDAVNIKDGYIVNIGIDFEITVTPGYNSNQVLLLCIDALKTKYSTQKLSFSSSILLKDIYTCLAEIDGVQSVIDVAVENKFGLLNGYSEHRYNMQDATYKDVIYPSLDPSCFEIKYPDQDIKGKVVSY